MKNLTDITIILDRSGSMSSIKNATIESFNSFINDQRSDGLPTRLSLVQFDDQYEVLYTDQDIKLAKYLTDYSFEPRGMTALLDAIGTTIKATKKRIKEKSKKKRPEKMIMVIITDGIENASRMFTREKIFKMIRKREEKDNWKFVFLAANQDAIAEGTRMGFSRDRSMTYFANHKSVKRVFSGSSRMIRDFKSNKTNDLMINEDTIDKEENVKLNKEKEIQEQVMDTLKKLIGRKKI